MVHPPVVVVDEHDNVVGEAMLDEARKRGLIYRVVFIIGWGPDGRVLLQKRSSQMTLYPNCWDVSASGHVDDNHSYLEAARLELTEEIGVRGASLKEVAHFFTDEPLWGGIASKRFVKIYETELLTLPQELGHDEVSAVRWFTPEEVHRLAEEHGSEIAEGLESSLPYIRERA